VKISSYGEPDYAFGQRMLTLRTQIGLTQAGLGQLLGVSRRAVVKWEGGLSYPSAGHLQALIALGMQQRVFAAGGEAEEIRALWRAAHQKVLLDEQWLQGLLATGHPRPTQPRRGSSPARPSTTVEGRPPGELVAPLVGRATAFSQLVGHYQQAQQGQPQAALLVGEAGIGKTRLAREFVAWARTQGAEVLSGQAFELGGRLPYQTLVEAIGPRLEEENAPEDLLSDLWLSELSRLLPELRVRYPDLPAPTEDDLTAKIRLFEAVARLVEALTLRAPLVLLFDDLHWMDGASLDLLRYLGHDWSRQRSRVLLLLTVRSEGLEPQSRLAVELSDLERDLPVSQVNLQPLSQTETLQLLEAVVGAREPGEAAPSRAAAAQPGKSETKLSGLGDILFAHTGGQPLYLLETLKLLREREWLVPELAADGTWRLALAVEIATVVAHERSQRELLPPSVRALIQARLAKLSQPAHQLVMTSAVLGTPASAQLLWQVAEVEAQIGVEALEEAIGHGILREEEVGESGGHLSSYGFSHDLMREVVYTELAAARRQVLHRRALASLEREGAKAAELAYHALAAGEAAAAYRASVQAGMEAAAVFAVEDAIGQYQQARALLQAHHGRQSEPPATEVERLYTHLGQAYAFQYAWAQAQEAYEELLAYAQQKRLPALASLTSNRLAILAVQQAQDRPKVRALLDDAWQMAQSSHDQRALAETAWNQAQITGLVWEDLTSALQHGQLALSLARTGDDQELEARSLFTLGVIHLRAGDFEETMHCAQASLALYARLGSEPSSSGELSLPYFQIGAPLTQHDAIFPLLNNAQLPYFQIGAPLTQPLTNRTSEAMCLTLLAVAQQQAGQVQASMGSSRRALALAAESKSVWVQVNSAYCLASGLLEAGAYEEALGLMQHTRALARTLPQSIILHRFLTVFGGVYHAMQQWDEARRILAEAVAVAETFDLGGMYLTILSQLCMHSAAAGEWEAAYQFALKAIALRKRAGAALAVWDFYRQYETEALLRGGDERQARADVQRLGESLGTNQRFRLPYLRSLAVLAEWEGQSEQAISHLHEAAGIAADLGLPAEQWQIQARLARVYEAWGEPVQAHSAWARAAAIIQGLAQAIGDEVLRSRFLAGPQIQQVLQQAQSAASPALQDHAEQNGR